MIEVAIMMVMITNILGNVFERAGEHLLIMCYKNAMEELHHGEEPGLFAGRSARLPLQPQGILAARE